MTGGQWKSGVALSVAALAGVVCAGLIIPRLFAKIDTDLERTRFLLRTVTEIKKGTTPAPDMVFLGNSVTMNGVDAELVAKELPNSPRIYNFSSTGQSVAEGYLYLQELPMEAKAVVLVVSPANLEDDGLPSEDVFNTFYMQGYRPNERTLESLSDVFKGVTDPKDPFKKPYDVALFSRNDIQQRFRSRWAIAQVPDTEFRKKLRKDLDTSKSIRSLTYPAPYSKPIAAKNFEVLLPTYNKPRTTPEFAPLETQNKLITKLVEQVRADGKKIAIVLAPMHPARLSFAGPEFRRGIANWANKHSIGCPVLDLSDSLTKDQFLDVVHPSREGAEIISKRIAEFLKGEGI